VSETPHLDQGLETMRFQRYEKKRSGFRQKREHSEKRISVLFGVRGGETRHRQRGGKKSLLQTTGKQCAWSEGSLSGGELKRDLR